MAEWIKSPSRETWVGRDAVGAVEVTGSSTPFDVHLRVGGGDVLWVPGFSTQQDATDYAETFMESEL